MNETEVISKIEYLVKKYVPGRDDLIELLRKDTDSIKYILAEISRYKKEEYDDNDRELIKEIAFFTFNVKFSWLCLAMSSEVIPLVVAATEDVMEEVGDIKKSQPFKIQMEEFTLNQ